MKDKILSTLSLFPDWATPKQVADVAGELSPAQVRFSLNKLEQEGLVIKKTALRRKDYFKAV